jgi:hypothetical protein
MFEGIEDCALCHGLQPQTVDRFLIFCRFHDVAEDQLTLASRITSVYDFIDLFTLKEFFESV